MTRRDPLSRATQWLAAISSALLVGAVVTEPLPAQGRPPLAIVGARIVDGSGNEPFTGTIVLSGGRISAVGRQVEPPVDAEKIDGTGRTVLPGLVEPRLRLTADGLGSDAGRRRLARALASGVTTAAIDGAAMTPSTPDATQPRLLPPPAIEGEPALTLPAGTHQLRNGTVAVSLDGDPKAAVDAVRAAKARVALAGVVADDGAVTPTRIGATGLTPLEAVTALTGAGAWALGLQSDRGLLAPGMRADVIVVAGDPTAALDALTQVERVYLGGVEVDRAALLRPPPAPEPVAPTAAAATPPVATPAAKPPARRRGRGSRAAASETPPAAPVVEAPAPAPESAAGAAPGPPAPTAVVGERLREPLLDDFERGDAVSAIGPGWVGSASETGGSATTLIMGRVVKGLRDHALLVSARMGAGREPYARAALKLDAASRPVDVSRFRGLRFDARGEGRYRVVFVTRGVTDGRYHESYFSGSPLWTPVGIPFASVGQNGHGDRVPWTGRDVVEVRFEMVRDAGKLGWLELDNVTFY